jgi:glycosyltransferase involved in cell wall biosynthesis
VTRPTVLLLITTFDIGGAERVLVGFKVIVACLQRRSGAVAREVSGVDVVDLRMASRWDVFVLWRLVRLLRAARVDVAYTFLLNASIVGRLAAWLAGTPIVLSSQQVMDWEGPLARLANRVTARLCTRVVAVSREVAAYLVREVGVPAARVVTIYNCVDPERFGRDGIQPPGTGVFGMVARLNPEKDHRTLIEAFRRVRARRPGARLVLAGDGPERAAIVALVRELRLEPSVELCGRLADVRDVLRRLDVYVQASQVEGLPVAVLEAMASGLPVVASDVGGNAEAVEGGVTGLLVPRRDPEAMAGAMDRLLTDVTMRLEMGRAGRARVQALFSTEAMLQETEGLLRALLAQHPTAGCTSPGPVTS